MISGFFRCFLYALAGIPVTLAGFFVVAVALPFRWAEGDPMPFSQYPQYGCWQRWRLPRWALLWDNAFDGVVTDKRGWFANQCAMRWYGFPSFIGMYIWTAIRNPANYWSRVVTGVDVSQCLIEKVAGQDVVSDSVGKTGWQVLRALRNDGKCFPRLYVVLPWWFRPDKAIMIDIGWKIKLSHNRTTPDARINDRMKGNVFTISPWKGL